jgi:hypothetical protein
MTVMKKKNYLNDSAEGAYVQHELQLMDGDSAFNTNPSYSANTKLYANNSVTFVQKHMTYLNNNPQVDAVMYLSNLRLITRIRM